MFQPSAILSEPSSTPHLPSHIVSQTKLFLTTQEKHMNGIKHFFKNRFMFYCISLEWLNMYLALWFFQRPCLRFCFRENQHNCNWLWLNLLNKSIWIRIEKDKFPCSIWRGICPCHPCPLLQNWGEIAQAPCQEGLSSLHWQWHWSCNKLASLEATLVRNYDRVTDGGEV